MHHAVVHVVAVRQMARHALLGPDAPGKSTREAKGSIR
jgi:hypothetical protein